MRIAKEEEEKVKDVKKYIQEKKEELANLLRRLVEENNDKTDAEKMSRDEFVIDHNGKEAIMESISTELNELKSNIMKDNSEVYILATRIRQECWDTMQNNACQIRTFSCNHLSLSVSNLPMRKMTPSDERAYELVLRLRMCEIRDIRRHPKSASHSGTCWAGFLDETLPTANFIVNTGKLGATDEYSVILSQHTASPTKNNGESVHKPNYADDENDDGYDSYIDIDHNCPHYYLLYPPLAVRTDGQRQTQLIILKGLICNIAINFNEMKDLKD